MRTSRSTVGTMTEITDYTKLLFARMAGLSCRACNRTVQRETPQSIFAQLCQLPAGTTIIITFPFQIKGRIKRLPIAGGYQAARWPGI